LNNTTTQINNSVDVSALNSLIEYYYIDPKTNPTLYNQLSLLESDISNYLYHNGSKPDINQTLVNNIVNNVSVNSKTNPTLYDQHQQLQKEIQTSEHKEVITDIKGLNSLLNSDNVNSLTNPTL